MIEVLNLIFTSFWTWLGAFLLLGLCVMGLVAITETLKGGRK